MGSQSRDFNKSGVLEGEEGQALTEDNLEGLLLSSDEKIRARTITLNNRIRLGEVLRGVCIGFTVVSHCHYIIKRIVDVLSSGE